MARAKLQKFMTITEVSNAIGYSPEAIYRMIRLGQFPAPIPAGPRRSVWLETAVAKWQSACIARARRGTAKRSTPDNRGRRRPYKARKPKPPRNPRYKRRTSSRRLKGGAR